MEHTSMGIFGNMSDNPEHAPITQEWIDGIGDNELTRSFAAESVNRAAYAKRDIAPIVAADTHGAALPDALARTFMLAGNATFTAVSKVTGARYTFKLSRPKADSEPRLMRNGQPFATSRKPIFISVLNGTDNTADYAYLGTIWEDAEKFTYAVGRKSQVSPQAITQRAAAWLTVALNYPDKLAQCEIYHAGKCGRCGRKLTVPSSIESGIGPECAKNAILDTL
jgi:hypothetical protein